MRSLHTKENWGLFLLRFGVGVVFIVHGYDKVVNFSSIIGMFDSFEFPAPTVFAVLLTATELLAGVALIIGFYSRIAAALTAVVMMMALILVKGEQGFLGAAELDFVILFSSLAIILVGPGNLRLRFSGLDPEKKHSDTNRSDGELSGYQHQI